MSTCNKNHNYMLIELRHKVKGGCQMTLMSWHTPGTLYIRYRRSHRDKYFLSICLKLLNFVRFEWILNMYKFECNNTSIFVFINIFYERFAQPS